MSAVAQNKRTVGGASRPTDPIYTLKHWHMQSSKGLRARTKLLAAAQAPMTFGHNIAINTTHTYRATALP